MVDVEADGPAELAGGGGGAIGAVCPGQEYCC